MKVAIPARGVGSRLAEETQVKPKPMVGIGGRPILWHIMMHYAHYGYIEGDGTQWEREPLERLAKDGQLMAYRHTSFWQCMDTLRDKVLLEELWQSGNAPWKIWR